MSNIISDTIGSLPIPIFFVFDKAAELVGKVAGTDITASQKFYEESKAIFMKNWYTQDQAGGILAAINKYYEDIQARRPLTTTEQIQWDDLGGNILRSRVSYDTAQTSIRQPAVVESGTYIPPPPPKLSPELEKWNPFNPAVQFYAKNKLLVNGVALFLGVVVVANVVMPVVKLIKAVKA